MSSKGRWISPDEYYWTTDGYFNALPDMTPELLGSIREATGGSFHDLSFVEQSRTLGIPVEQVSPYEMCQQFPSLSECLHHSVERFAQEYFARQGWIGDYLEGAPIHFILSAMRRAAESQGIKGHRTYDPTTVTWMVHRTDVEPQELQILKQIVNEFDDLHLEQEYGQWKADVLARKSYVPLPKVANPKSLTLEIILTSRAMFDDDQWLNLIKLSVLGFHGFGWPDLTLSKEGEIVFIEVKQAADKFTIRQPYWWRNICRPLGFQMKGLQVSPSLRQSARRICAGFPNKSNNVTDSASI